jgi:CBS domain containing-hemolysin-like protein
MRTLDSLHEHDSALQSLQRMRKRGRSLCLVLDDQELPSGILHEEDLLRQLMGTRL